MIGNDIVDLAQAAKESDWTRKGYLDKIFTTEEQFMIAAEIYPSIMVWLLWSMKEAAYKINSRETKLRSFAPAKLCCSNLIIHDGKANGNVYYEDQVYFTTSTIERDFIHTIAAIREEDLNKVRIEITDCGETSSSNYKCTNPISVSHHGKYLALTYL